jgi:hypothetical protein
MRSCTIIAFDLNTSISNCSFFKVDVHCLNIHYHICIIKWNMTYGSKFFKVYQNLITVSSFFNFFYLVRFYHVKTHLWMIMMEFWIVMV